MNLEQTTTEIIDLCTPTLNNDDRSIVTQLLQIHRSQIRLFARFQSHYHRL